jgi:hypothetical protein
MPGGTLDVRGARFEAADERAVRVSGSRFERSRDYYVKLEGAALVGYRAICVAGVRDPLTIRALDDILPRVREKIEAQLGAGDWRLHFRVYGRDGVMGEREPYAGGPPHEVGLVIEVVAPEQDVADAVCALARSATLHLGYDGRKATAGNLAFPYSPAEFPAPPAYEFRAYHLLRLDDPRAPFATTWETV